MSESEVSVAPQKNEKLEKYNVKQCIGEGAFGTVNLGEDKETGQQVAIKIVSMQ